MQWRADTTGTNTEFDKRAWPIQSSSLVVSLAGGSANSPTITLGALVTVSAEGDDNSNRDVDNSTST